MHGKGNLEKAINLLDQNDKKDFSEFVNSEVSFNPHNMFICRSKKILNKTNYFAKRFAAKESFVKAVGSGFRDGINFKDIEISNNKLGKPYYIINKKIKNFLKKKIN